MNNPLVSVAVITYNSAKTVIETLDSIYNQTYQNIELVISDDCSKDNTIVICKDWLATHKGRFVRTELVVAPKNGGVSANWQRGEDACQGEWIKTIAGDDILLPICIARFVEYVSEHQNAVYVFSRVECFGGTPERIDIENKRLIYDFFSWPNNRQYEFLIFEWNCLPGVTNFYNLPQIRKIGLLYDKRIPLIEDYPRWINVLNNRLEMDFIDEILVRYRLSDNSLSTQNKYSKAYQKSMAKIFRYYQADANIKRFGYIYTLNHYCNLRYTWSGNAFSWWFLLKLSKIPIRIKRVLCM